MCEKRKVSELQLRAVLHGPSHAVLLQDSSTQLIPKPLNAQLELQKLLPFEEKS